MITKNAIRLAIAIGGAAAILTAHATWIEPVPPILETRKAVTVEIGNGHGLGASESPLGQRGLEVFVIGPTGSRTKLTPAVAGNSLKAEHTIKEPGTHVFAFVQDRGLNSRTPGGMKKGGKDQNPDALEVVKAYRSAVAHAATKGAAPAAAKPVGLEFEMVPQRTAEGVTVTVLFGGKPRAGARINVLWPGKGEQKAGATGTDGKFVYRIPAGAKGRFLLAADFSEKAAAGAGYDNATYATAIYLTW